MQKINFGKSVLAGIAFLTAVLCGPAGVCAAEAGSLHTVSEESQILSIPDGSGKYMLKSNGFYCLNEDGTLDGAAAVHYFEHFVIDGTRFDGYYYHDESGKFRAGNPHMVSISLPDNPVPFGGDAEEYAAVFDGSYMVNNLGKLTAAPQVRYMDNLVLKDVTYNGYYYFNEFGRLVTETGIHTLEMTSNGQKFNGSYYFGGINGVLVQERGVTPDGFAVDSTGRLCDMDEFGMETLEPRLKELLAGYEGEWSVLVKDLNTEEQIEINNKPLYSASLIKAFVLAKSYEDMDEIKKNEGSKIKADPDSDQTKVKINDLLWNMITVSDNESYNELVRLLAEDSDFLKGAQEMNRYLKREGYTDTSVQNTLSPSASKSVGLGGRNTTSVRDCARLLERIYRGECVSKEASEEMLNLFLNQEVTWKIPEGLPASVKAANKTGETDSDQHDIAIVYGEKTTYILCVMSENCPEDTAIHNIRDISRVVYNYLNI